MRDEVDRAAATTKKARRAAQRRAEHGKAAKKKAQTSQGKKSQGTRDQSDADDKQSSTPSPDLGGEAWADADDIDGGWEDIA